MGNARKGERIIGQGTQTVSSPHSAIFKASLAYALVETEVMADQKADANLVSGQLLDSIQKKKPNIGVTHLSTEQIYHGVTETLV